MWKNRICTEKNKKKKEWAVENGYKLIKTVHNKKCVENKGILENIHSECGKKLKNLSTTYQQIVDKKLQQKMAWKLWKTIWRISVENVDEKFLDLAGKSAYN